MSSWLRCECGEVLRSHEVDVRVEYERSEFWGQIATTTEEVWTCPSCGSENLDDFFPCLECVRLGEHPPAEPLEGADYCERHLEE